MLVITVNPKFFAQHGGFTLSGIISDTAATVEWRYSDEGTFKTKGVLQDGQDWSLDLQFASNRDSIVIHAVSGPELSNNLSVDLSTAAGVNLTPSFQFNEFDELGLASDISRIPAEDNEDFRQRILDVYRNPGNSTQIGLNKGLERELGLPHLAPLFSLSVRWNPVTNKGYKEVFVSFLHNEASVQIREFIIYNELIDLDPTTDIFVTKESIGSEFLDDDNIIRITNGDKPIPPNSFKKIDDRTISINTNTPEIDITKKFFITYPFRKIFKYKFVNESTGELGVKDLNELRTFLEEVDTVVDEFSNTVPLIVWNDGFLELIDELPDGEVSESRITFQQAVNLPPSTGFTEVTDVTPSEIYEYKNPFASKAFFTAAQIIDTGRFVLTVATLPIQGGWASLDEFHDENFRELLETIDDPKSDKNIIRFATELRDAVHLGIENALVNHDVWGSDAPDIIGNTFVPSFFDGGLKDFKILSDGGNISGISLKKRKYFARYMSLGTSI